MASTMLEIIPALVQPVVLFDSADCFRLFPIQFFNALSVFVFLDTFIINLHEFDNIFLLIVCVDYPDTACGAFAF